MILTINELKHFKEVHIAVTFQCHHRSGHQTSHEQSWHAKQKRITVCGR